MILDPSGLTDTVLFGYHEKNLQPNSCDLRLGRVFRIQGGIKLYADGTKEMPPYEEQGPDTGGFFHLGTGVLYQLEFMEYVKLPLDVAAISIMRSSMSKSGASGEPGLYDSGYNGTCGMTVSVKHHCVIEKGASVAQLVFMRADASKAYDGDYLDMKWADKLLRNVDSAES